MSGKAGLKYAGPEVDAMQSVAQAYKKRSIHDLERVFAEFKSRTQTSCQLRTIIIVYAELVDDSVVQSHVAQLRAQLLEQNLLRVLEPFSRVQIAHVARLIDLPLSTVEPQLSEMILDQKLNGILDQGAGDIILFDQPQADQTFEAALATVKELDRVADRLFTKAKFVTAA